MKKKLRKFSDGGYSTVDSENPVPSIDEGVRSRAMKFVEDASEESRDLGKPMPTTPPKSAPVASKPAAPVTPKVDMEAERERMEKLTKSQALEPVHPEDYIPGAGLLKPMLKKVVEMGVKRTAKEAAEKTAETAAKNVVRKAEEGFNPTEALEKINPAKVHNVGGRKIPQKRTPKKTNSTEGMVDDGGAGAFKRGGKVSSASRRADGCCVKGKTKGRMV
jgi:hypothetical protein